MDISHPYIHTHTYPYIGNATLFKAEVLGKSDYSDLALLRVPDDGFWEGVAAIKMEHEDVKLGELVNGGCVGVCVCIFCVCG
jgi:hypothetical protein